MEQKKALPLSDLTPNDLLNLFYALKDSPTKDHFYTYFNDIREELTGNHYETSPSNIRRWMSKRNRIKGQNLSRAMAKGIFMDILGGKAAQSMDSIKQFLKVLYGSGYDVSVYQERINPVSLNVAEASAFLEELISDVVDAAFGIHTGGESHETAVPGTLLPYYFADTEFADKDSILHRERFIDEIARNLLPEREGSEMPKRNILIYGFGGHGKTSVARVLYGLFRNKIPAIYSSIGWIDYNESLKNSILNTSGVALYDEEKNDPELRWKKIKGLLCSEDRSSKILVFIDNVDQNASKGQFPTEDAELQFFADCTTVNLVLTSRMAAPIRENSVRDFPIPVLDTKECIDLFYYYWKPKTRRAEDIKYIEALIERAHHHTLVVEKMARSARCKEIAEYLEEIQSVDFNFYYFDGEDDVSAVTELVKLFDLKTRTDRQAQIMWDFAVLPQIRLSFAEANHLLNYKQSDLLPLVDEGWLDYKGGFILHPLIKKAIHFQGTAPQGTLQFLIDAVETNTLFSKDDSYVEINRKLSILEYAVGELEEEALSGTFFFNLGMMEYTYARKRLASIDYLNTALKKFELESPDDLSRMANLKYQRGYIKSTTQKYRSAAKEDLYEALKIWDAKPEWEYEADMAKDHLGYVLSDQPEHYEEAESYLRAACSSRERRFNRDPSIQNQKDYATTCDNLGCLLMVSDPTAPDTGAYLEKALHIRDSILDQIGGNETDVAWTAFNYGKYLFYVKHDLPGAERNLSRSLTLRREQNRICKGFYSTNVIFTDVTLAKILSYDPSRIDDVSDLLKEALQLKKDLDAEHLGFFNDEIKQDIAYLQQFIAQNRSDKGTHI